MSQYEGADVHTLFPDGVDFTDLKHKCFNNVQREDDGLGNEIETFDSTVEGLVNIGAGPMPVMLSGPVTVVVFGKTNNTTGTFQTEMVSMSLTGDVGGMPIEIRESPGLPSLGQTAITDLGGDQWQIDSFFDVFTELSVAGGPFMPQTNGPGRMELVPLVPSGCRCVPTETPCDQSDPATCGGICPNPDEVCTPDSAGGPCFCEQPLALCEESVFPECGGDCPPNTHCEATGSDSVVLASPTLPAEGEPRECEQVVSQYEGDSVHALFPGGVDFSDPKHKCFQNVQREDDGSGNEIETFDSIVEGLVDLGSGPMPVTLTGPVAVVVFGKTGHATGTFQTEMVSMSLTGDVRGITIELRESPSLAASGETTITDLGGGLWQIDSFFDVSTELSVNGGPFMPQTNGPGRMVLVPVDPGVCECVPDEVTCEQSDSATCDGTCLNPGEVCTSNPFGGACFCETPPSSCEQSTFPECPGECAAGEACVPAASAALCRCDSTGGPCTQCGPGAHFIDACGPFPPVGTDLVANTGAVVGIDLDLDCIRDINVVLHPCPAPNGLLQINKTLGPLDDSVNFPGTSPVDGHPTGPGLDVIDTEIASMCLTDGTITLVAGTGGPSAMPLRPSLGTVAEDLTTPDPTMADSFFDVFFEVSGVPDGPLYNKVPLQIKGRINCLPPAANYSHPVGICLPLISKGVCSIDGNSCVTDLDCPSGTCDGGEIVANLVSANHSVNQPVCDDSSFPECGGDCPLGDICTAGQDGCSCEPIPCDESPIPACGGECPPGSVCEPSATGGGCSCTPIECTPTTGGTACTAAPCLDLANDCVSRCMSFNPQTGETSIIDCKCSGPGECHIVAAGADRGGDPCIVPDDGTGTITLPPAGCEYLSPDEVHEIIDGLPPGTTIELDAIHKDFICDRDSAGPCSVALPLAKCEDRGGSLGGHVDCFDSTLELHVNGTGLLAGFQRSLFVPISCEIHTGPRNPGDAVQTFPTEMVQLQGELFGDPDFCTFRVTGGSDSGLPSPGHTTLTQLPSGDFSVDSFFDITYEIEFAGCAGSVLEGFAGVTQAAIRMATESGPALPSCAGICPFGTICEQTATQNGDGTLDVCCDCVAEPPPCSPTADRLSCNDVMCPIDTDVCFPAVVHRGVSSPFFPTAGTDDINLTTGQIQIVDPAGAVNTFFITGEAPNNTQVLRRSPTNGAPFRSVQTEILSMDLHATSPGGQQVLIHLSPALPSVGEVKGAADNTTDFPADSFFDVFVTIDIPGIPGAVGLSHGLPIRLEALQIAEIPPWGSSFETPTGWEGVDLVGANGEPTGFRLGQVTHQLPPPPPEWHVADCDCLPEDACHVVFDPSRVAPVWCEGRCPVGLVCDLISDDTDGDGTDDTFKCRCAPEPPIACCNRVDGSCLDLTAARCEEIDGLNQGPDTTCDTVECPAIEIDEFPFSLGEVELLLPLGNEVIQLNGSATARVLFDGPVDGSADDDDGDGLDEVTAELTELELSGQSAFLGAIEIRLHPSILSRGEIRELSNATFGTLDLPPFAATGTAHSSFDIFFQIDLPDSELQLFSHDPTVMSAAIDHKPPRAGTVYESTEVIRLYDGAGNPTEFFLGAGRYLPRPRCGGGDINDDGVLTLADFVGFHWCFEGPVTGPPDADCIRCFDYDNDGDVDLRDLSVFLRLLLLQP